jgi:hypothetical protein
MLSVNDEFVRYDAPSISSTGSVGYAPSFEVRLANIKIIGYAPRMIGDEESGFLILVSATGQIHYFNLDIADQAATKKLEQHFGYHLVSQVPDISLAEINWHSFILYPETLSGQPLFQSWNWFTLRGLLKNLNKQLATDNPMWERLTDNAKAYPSTVHP